MSKKVWEKEMKHLLKQSWVYLLLVTFSSSVFGHVATEHALPLGEGLLHILSDPMHVFPLSLFLFIGLLFAMRKQLSLLGIWIATNIFRQ